eukprot:14704144-Ditylum_brightwellii.AAC.1
MKFTTATLYYNLHLPSVIRYAGNNYTTAYQDIDDILRNIKGIVPPENYAKVERVFQVGSPAMLKAESSRENFLIYWRYGNHSTLQKS